MITKDSIRWRSEDVDHLGRKTMTGCVQLVASCHLDWDRIQREVNVSEVVKRELAHRLWEMIYGEAYRAALKHYELDVQRYWPPPNPQTDDGLLDVIKALSFENFYEASQSETKPEVATSEVASV